MKTRYVLIWNVSPYLSYGGEFFSSIVFYIVDLIIVAGCWVWSLPQCAPRHVRRHTLQGTTQGWNVQGKQVMHTLLGTTQGWNVQGKQVMHTLQETTQGWNVQGKQVMHTLQETT